MAGGRRIVVEFLGKDKTLGKTANEVDGRVGKLGGRMKGVGAVAGKALAGGFLLAGAAAVKMGNAAADDEAAQSKLAQTLHQGAGATDAQVAATEKWITAQGKALGVTDDDLRPAIAKLATATKDVGKAQEYASLAMNVSAGRGISLASVTKTLENGINGNVAGFRKLGVQTKNANGETKSLDQITKELARTYNGAAAKAADTTAGKQRKLQVQYGELQEAIGTKLLPIMAKLADWGLKTIDWMSKHETLIKSVASVIVPLVAGLYLFAKAMAVVNAVMAMNPIGLVVIALGALVIGLVYALNHSKKFRDGVMNAFAAVGNAGVALWNKVLKPTFKFMVNAWLNVAGWILKGAAKAFGWVPGVGPKLKAAAAKFDSFKRDVNNHLDGVHKKVSITANTKQARGEIRSFVKFAKQQINGLPKNTHTGKAGGVGNLLLQTVGHNAAGTSNWRGGPTWVGERGPEIINAPRGSQILSNKKSMAAGGDTYILHFHGVATSEREIQRWMRKGLLELKRSNGGAPLGLA